MAGTATVATTVTTAVATALLQILTSQPSPARPLYSMVCPAGLPRFGKGTLAIYGFGAFWGFFAGQSRECLLADRKPLLGTKIVKNVQFGSRRAFS